MRTNDSSITKKLRHFNVIRTCLILTTLSFVSRYTRDINHKCIILGRDVSSPFLRDGLFSFFLLDPSFVSAQRQYIMYTHARSTSIENVTNVVQRQTTPFTRAVCLVERSPRRSVFRRSIGRQTSIYCIHAQGLNNLLQRRLRRDFPPYNVVIVLSVRRYCRPRETFSVYAVITRVDRVHAHNCPVLRLSKNSFHHYYCIVRRCTTRSNLYDHPPPPLPASSTPFPSTTTTF